jgi:TolB-like protein
MVSILRVRISVKILTYFSWLFVTLLLFHLPVYSQDSPLKILLFDFKEIAGNQKYEKLEQELPKQLKNFLNQSIKTNTEAQRFEKIRTKKEYFSPLPPQKPMKGFLAEDDLKPIIDSAKVGYNYILVGRFWEKLGVIRAEVRLIDCKTYGIICSFSESEPDKDEIRTIQERLAEKFLKDIEMHLLGRIRIGLIDFKMTGGNSAFRFLEESIPTMLATGLSASREFILIETKSESQLLNKREEGRRGIFDDTTILEVGRKLNANYLIMGEFWEYGAKMRIDARCVSIETGEIILSEAIALERIEITNITNEIKLLASKIRIKIEKDFMKKEKQTKSIAVVSFPPSPNSKKNRLVAGHIRKTLVRKLWIVPDLRVKENSEKIRKYIEGREDKLKICSDLDISSLLTIQYEELHGDIIILDVELYDIAKPTQELYADTKKTKYKKLDEFINKVIYEALKDLEINEPSVEKRKEIEAIQVPTFSTRWTIGGTYSLVGHASKEHEGLFPLGNIGDYFELFLNYQLNNRTKVELQAGIDIGSSEEISTTDKLHISCMHFSLPLKYDLIQTSAFDVYAGLGITVFQVFRNIIGDSGVKGSLDAFGAGLMTLIGIEVKLKKVGITFYLEPRYIIGTEVEKIESEYPEYPFRGGRLGGFYFSLGIGYGFNF